MARLDTWTISTIHKALPENIPVLGVSAGYMRFHHCRTLVVLGPEIRGFGEVALMGAPDWELLMSELPGTADGAAEFDMVRYDLAVLSLVACNHQTTPQLDLYDYSCALCFYKDTEKQCRFHLDEGVPYLAAADAAGAPPARSRPSKKAHPPQKPEPAKRRKTTATTSVGALGVSQVVCSPGEDLPTNDCAREFANSKEETFSHPPGESVDESVAVPAAIVEQEIWPQEPASPKRRRVSRVTHIGTGSVARAQPNLDEDSPNAACVGNVVHNNQLLTWAGQWVLHDAKECNNGVCNKCALDMGKKHANKLWKEHPCVNVRGQGQGGIFYANLDRCTRAQRLGLVKKIWNRMPDDVPEILWKQLGDCV